MSPRPALDYVGGAVRSAAAVTDFLPWLRSEDSPATGASFGSKPFHSHDTSTLLPSPLHLRWSPELSSKPRYS